MTKRVAKKSQLTGLGMRLGRIQGVDIAVHSSLLIIFALIVLSLGAGVFPAWHPQWGFALRWGMALLAAVLFFASILLHELSHALVGRTQGVPVESITLFIFGGMAHTTRQPPSAKAELLMAAVGPLVSLLIGLAATYLGSWLAYAAIPEPSTVAEGPAQILASAGPLATVFLWLGPINILLAIFNMMPGFPLDGGRVFRAFLWWMTGDLEEATRYASGVGQLFAWVLIGCGIAMIFGIYIPILGTGIIPGLWLAFIGWFLLNATRMSYQEVVIRELLEGVPVRTVMRSRVLSVPPDLSINNLISDYFMNNDQRSFPVVDGTGNLLGLVTLDDLRTVSREHWPSTRVADMMTPIDQIEGMGPQEPAMDALQFLGSHDVDQIPVLEGSHLYGMVHQKDIMKWLTLHTPRS